jgi:hypothetical protein
MQLSYQLLGMLFNMQPERMLYNSYDVMLFVTQLAGSLRDGTRELTNSVLDVGACSNQV